VLQQQLAGEKPAAYITQKACYPATPARSKF